MSRKSTGAVGTSTPRVLAASLVGTAVEFYDFYIYATAASLVFGPLFFPSASPAVQLLAAYATLGVAFIARPVGAVVFGHFGDRIGRKVTLVASLLLMGGSTVVIGLLPTYAMVGWPAPALLCLLRFGQGFGLGGEWGGAVLLAVENAPQLTARASACFRNWARRWDSLPPTAFFLYSVRRFHRRNLCHGDGGCRFSPARCWCDCCRPAGQA